MNNLNAIKLVKTYVKILLTTLHRRMSNFIDKPYDI